MRIGSLFSGIGGLELGLECSGLGRAVWQVEKDEFCRRVLERHWPDVARFDDVRTVGAATLPPVDLICGGFPCQDVSSAGNGAGLAGERSGLWFEFARIVDEMAPEWVVVENVLSGASRWLDTVLRSLEELGYECLPLPLSAEDVGAPHRRRRLFVVAHAYSQPGWGGSTDAHRDGAAGNATDAERFGRAPRSSPEPSQHSLVRHADRAREPQSEVRALEQVGGRWPSDPTWWATEPGVRGVAHGVPNRAHRLRALGNAVVPQCAEVVGWVIRELGGVACGPQP